MARLELVELGHERLGPVSLALEAGSCLGLAGSSGAGKSQLLRAIADLDPNQGEVLLDGRPRSASKAHEWRCEVAYLAAESHWWFERVGEHFSTEPTAEACAQLGFETGVMQWQVARCSTGEKQRLALLRTLGNSPRVLLLDEPTAALDPGTTERVEALLSEYRRNTGAVLVWVSHDTAQLDRVADQRLRVVSGQLVAWEERA